jgi:hypothetical protein
MMMMEQKNEQTSLAEGGRPGPSYMDDDRGGGKGEGNWEPRGGPMQEGLILSWGLSQV